MNMLHVLLNEELTFFMLQGLTGHADDLRQRIRIRMLDEENNSGDGIAHDLAFCPTEGDSESL